MFVWLILLLNQSNQSNPKAYCAYSIYFVGGFIGVLIALARNMLRSGIKDSSQIENEFDLPVYATVPRSPVQETRMSILKEKEYSNFSSETK